LKRHFAAHMCQISQVEWKYYADRSHRVLTFLIDRPPF
jgi:hypothetical protein